MTIFDRPLLRLPVDLLASTKAAVADPLPRRERWKLFPLVAGIALGLYALSFWIGDPSLVRLLVWFVGAALAHDLVLFPVYAALDRPLHRAHLHRAHLRLPRTRVPLINHVRVPALGAGLTLLVFLPGIIRQGGDVFTAATGLDQSPYLGRWLVFVAALFACSALVWLGRTLLAHRPSPPVAATGLDATGPVPGPADPPPDPPVASTALSPTRYWLAVAASVTAAVLFRPAFRRWTRH